MSLNHLNQSLESTNYHENINRLIIGLEIGEIKTFAVVGNNIESEIVVLGTGANIQNGVEAQFESTANIIRNAIADAERNHGYKINCVVSGIAERQHKGWNCSGVVAIKNVKVSQEDLSRALEVAKSSIPDSCDILHIFPQECIVDELSGINDPIGITGIRLEVRVFIVTSS